MHDPWAQWGALRGSSPATEGEASRLFLGVLKTAVPFRTLQRYMWGQGSTGGPPKDCAGVILHQTPSEKCSANDATSEVVPVGNFRKRLLCYPACVPSFLFVQALHGSLFARDVRMAKDGHSILHRYGSLVRFAGVCTHVPFCAARNVAANHFRVIAFPSVGPYCLLLSFVITFPARIPHFVLYSAPRHNPLARGLLYNRSCSF